MADPRWWRFASARYVSITPNRPLTADTVHAYADAGVHRLIVYPVTAKNEAEAERFLADHAALVIG